MPSSLTSLGIVHTLFSLVAIASAIVCFANRSQIDPSSASGRIYLLTTAATALTALGIFQHGSFGPPHGLALLTLTALVFGLLATSTSRFGALGQSAQTVAFSSTLLFHAIPGVTETLTRLPPEAPILPSPDAPQFKVIYAVLLAAFLVGLAFQLRRLRSNEA